MIALSSETELQRMVRERRQLEVDLARTYQREFNCSFIEAYEYASQLLADGRRP